MKFELKAVSALRAAKVSALVYGLIFTVIAVIAFPIWLSETIFARQGSRSLLRAVVLVLAYPVVGLVVGWISGLVSAACYNFAAHWSGGLLLELSQEGAE
ncbi:MAG: hypothetical protein AAF657_40355 [Acidobacteriota bacterium]